MDELLQAKLNLYSLLISKESNKELNGVEEEILYHLSKDFDIRKKIDEIQNYDITKEE